jgi:hypothetical protein
VSAQPKNTRRTLAGLLPQVALELAERTGMRLAAALGIAVHRGTLLRLALGLPDPVASTAPDVVGVDDFALRRGHVSATVLAGAATGRAVDRREDGAWKVIHRHGDSLMTVEIDPEGRR